MIWQKRSASRQLGCHDAPSSGPPRSWLGSEAPGSTRPFPPVVPQCAVRVRHARGCTARADRRRLARVARKYSTEAPGRTYQHISRLGPFLHLLSVDGHHQHSMLGVALGAIASVHAYRRAKVEGRGLTALTEVGRARVGLKGYRGWRGWRGCREWRGCPDGLAGYEGCPCMMWETWVAVGGEGGSGWRGCLEGCLGEARLVVLLVVRLELSKARLTHVSSMRASLLYPGVCESRVKALCGLPCRR